MKKVIVYLLAAGMGMTTIAMTPSTAFASHRHRMMREERREERRERKHDRYISMSNMNMNSNDYYYRMMWPQPALPVREGYVSPDVLSTFQNKYGASLYDVTPLKTVNGVDRYSVRMINNGVAEEVIVDGTGAPAL
ncbi:hypothetical protein CLV59_103283 [Chitinophaga dinghuensis]|uniref:PepSY-like beta-lactamase-inhibitor n=1 Tax=Chitinophaga dinghuensis TaxID=1539050 RepID=A0A327W253_9BACT|nr:hypothetical protein [Chitinophaga dinghuensis]RAJ83319.1 hypothetical protein CLV59_103283 [Chitinophaga dinghuensis]